MIALPPNPVGCGARLPETDDVADVPLLPPAPNDNPLKPVDRLLAGLLSPAPPPPAAVDATESAVAVTPELSDFAAGDTAPFRPNANSDATSPIRPVFCGTRLGCAAGAADPLPCCCCCCWGNATPAASSKRLGPPGFFAGSGWGGGVEPGGGAKGFRLPVF